MKLKFCGLLLLLIFTCAVKAEETEEEELIVVTGCGPMDPLPESYKKDLSTGFQLSVASNKHIYTVDHKKLYQISRKEVLLEQTIDLASDDKDWIFDVALKNKILVVLGYSVENQANKILRYRLTSGGLQKLDEYRIEFPPKEKDSKQRNFNAPLVVNDKAIFFKRSLYFDSFKIYRIFRGREELVRDIQLENLDGENFSQVILFADLFKTQIEFRDFPNEISYSLGETDGFRAYSFIAYEDIVEFKTKISAYNDYISYLTAHHSSQIEKATPYSYLLTFDLITERYKLRAFESFPFENWELELDLYDNNGIVQNKFYVYENDDWDRVFRLELTPSWHTKRKIPLMTSLGELSVELGAFDKNFLSISDDSHESEILSTKLFWLDEYNENLKEVELNQSVNYMMPIGKNLLTKGNSLDGVLQYSLIDGKDVRSEWVLKLDDYVDALADDEAHQFLILESDKYLVPSWVALKNKTEKSDLMFDAIDFDLNAYNLLLLGLHKNQMQVIDSYDLSVFDNGHCQVHCDGDPADYWDNRRILTDKNQVIILKGSIVDVYEFDRNFKYTKKSLNLRNSYGS
ncbi:MAG: hypothetical protein HWE16_09150 [Gammaproteobacteria bacterium]|nr:hypothetical protein [Gammaproteobacteria bacterium]